MLREALSDFNIRMEEQKTEAFRANREAGLGLSLPSVELNKRFDMSFFLMLQLHNIYTPF